MEAAITFYSFSRCFYPRQDFFIEFRFTFLSAYLLPQIHNIASTFLYKLSYTSWQNKKCSCSSPYTSWLHSPAPCEALHQGADPSCHPFLWRTGKGRGLRCRGPNSSSRCCRCPRVLHRHTPCHLTMRMLQEDAQWLAIVACGTKMYFLSCGYI